MYRILLRRRGRPESRLGQGLDEADVLRLFYILHNAAHVVSDPVPLVCPRPRGDTALLFPQEIQSLRLLHDGVDVTEQALVDG